MAKKRRPRASKKVTGKRSDSRYEPLDSLEGGLDGDLQTDSGAETTGRMLVVNLGGTTSASTKNMLKSIANWTGLGSRSSAVVASSDFGEGGIDEKSSADAEVVMLEDLGIALLNGDVDQNAAATAMMDSTADDGLVFEPEYMNHALGFLSDVDDIDMLEDQSTATFDGGVDAATVQALLQTLLTSGGLGTAGISTGGGSALSTRCFSDTPSSTYGLKATNVISSRFTGAGIKVAVLDSGMDLNHPDFKGRVIQHSVFVPASERDNRINDINGHGTHCIGTACGSARSIFGPRYGVATGAQIFAGKVLAHNFLPPPRTSAGGGDFGILRGIQWALTNRCEIISMSLGARVTAPGFPQSYEQAARQALRQGSLIIAATGNDSRRDLGRISAVGRPANCPSIVGVAAVDRCMKIAFFSNGRLFPNVGAEVNLSGPGVNVFSSLPRQPGIPVSGRPTVNIGALSGTSMATPHVSGIAALIAEETGLRGVPLYREMRRRARPLGNSRDFGNGLAQA